MIKNKSTVWKEEETLQFAEVLVKIDNLADMKNFLRDVMTEKEIVEISARLEAARLLSVGEKYTEITTRTKLSSRTVARISNWLKNGCLGYQVAIQKLNSQHDHTQPARAE